MYRYVLCTYVKYIEQSKLQTNLYHKYHNHTTYKISDS